MICRETGYNDEPEAPECFCTDDTRCEYCQAALAPLEDKLLRNMSAALSRIRRAA